MSAVERWERVAATLTAAGVPAKAHSCSIDLRTSAGFQIIIRDTWWSKNLDIWTGYQVELANPADITMKLWPRTKKRSEVRDAVLAAMEESS